MSRSRFALLLLLIPGLGAQVPTALPAQDAPASAAGEARIIGRVVTVNNEPVRGATVLAYHLSSARTFSSESDERGRFEIDGLPYGYFDVAVQSPEGLFVANQVLNVPPSGKTALNMTLVPGGTSGSDARGFVGTEQEAAGVAQVDPKKTTGQFLRSKTGIAILGGIGGLALLALAVSGDEDEQPVSPTTP